MSASPTARVRSLPEHAGRQCPPWQDAAGGGVACLLDGVCRSPAGETHRAPSVTLGHAAVRVCLAGGRATWPVPLILSSLTVRKAALLTALFLLATDFQGN